MPTAQDIARAEIREIRWNQSGEAQEINTGRTTTVQFNPATMRVSFSNQKSGGDQRGGSAMQFTGKGSTKLSVDLLFDVTGQLPSGRQEDDVRKLTSRIVYFITPVPTQEADKFVPPGVRFVWGSFLFDGVVDSMNETLEYFSADGRPLRATVSIELSQQEIQFRFNPDFAGPGTSALAPAQQGDSIQQAASRLGKPEQWKDIAAKNGVENPRNLAPGTLLTV
jgi:hypothetical protein